MSFFAHETAVVEDGAVLGEGVRVWHHAHVRAGARLGAGTGVGKNAYIGRDVRIGRGCKIQNNVNVYEGVTLEDHVFCGPSMTFTNLSSPLPRAAIGRRAQLQQTLVREGASLGAGAVIVCGVEIGRFAFVAAGAIVVRDVRPFELVAGNPARHLGWACVCGARLNLDAGESVCAAEYALEGVDRRCGRAYALGQDGALELVQDPHGGRPA